VWKQLRRFSSKPEQAAAGYDIALRFEVTRREYARDLQATNTKTPKATEAMMRRYLEPDKMVPLNATIAELARAQTEFYVEGIGWVPVEGFGGFEESSKA